MCQWLGRRRGQPDRGATSDKRDVEPKGEAVHVARLKNVEFERDFDAVQLRLVNLFKIENVALRLGEANANVERVNLKTKFED